MVDEKVNEYRAEAREIFRKTMYYQTRRTEENELLEREIEKLARNMTIIRMAGMDKLNSNLIEFGPRNIWDIIAEHNFAIELLKYNPDVFIEYEPEYLYKPPDFVVRKNGVTFWLQMKKLSKGERENRQDSIFRIIKEKLKDIGIPKFVSIMLAEDFKEQDINALIATIRKKAVKKNNKYYRFQYKNVKRLAEFSFRIPKRVKLQNLVLGSNGDTQMVNITGLNANQANKSFEKASKAFEWDCDSNNINLIVMEADNIKNIDIGDACFGNEFDFIKNGKVYWGRTNNGFFNERNYCSKVAGVIAVRRRENKPIPSSYSKTLFINERYVEKLEVIMQVIDLDEIIHYYDRIPAYDKYKLNKESQAAY